MILALIFVIGSCPIWCATFEASLDLPCSHAGSHPSAERQPTTPLPVNNDDCVCNGAILAASPLSTIGDGPSFSPLDIGGLLVIDLAALSALSRECGLTNATQDSRGDRCALLVAGSRMRC